MQRPQDGRHEHKQYSTTLVTSPVEPAKHATTTIPATPAIPATPSTQATPAIPEAQAIPATPITKEAIPVISETPR